MYRLTSHFCHSHHRTKGSGLSVEASISTPEFTSCAMAKNLDGWTWGSRKWMDPVVLGSLPVLDCRMQLTLYTSKKSIGLSHLLIVNAQGLFVWSFNRHRFLCGNLTICLRSFVNGWRSNNRIFNGNFFIQL